MLFNVLCTLVARSWSFSASSSYLESQITNQTYLEPVEVPLASLFELKQVDAVVGLFDFFELSVVRENHEVVGGVTGALLEPLQLEDSHVLVLDYFQLALATVGRHHAAVVVHSAALVLDHGVGSGRGLHASHSAHQLLHVESVH